MLGGLGLDVLTKLLIVAHVTPGVPVRWLGGLITLRLIRNSGAAFSSGQKLTWVFATAAIVVLGYVIIRLVPRLNHPGWSVALGLLCAGVAGNLVDRIFRSPGPLRGHVVDFIQIPFFGAIFNLADVCITVAAGLILYLSVIKNVAINGQRYARPAKAARGAAPRDAGSGR